MRVWAIVIALGACGDTPSLQIVVEHPAGIAITKTVVSVYESDSLHCEDIAFTRLGADELDALLVAEETRGADGSTTGALSGISRTDHKVIVARGYGDAAWLTAGCVEADVVAGKLVLTIATMATVTAATVLETTDTADPTLAVIATTDATGKAVSTRRVSWNVYGPAGSQPMYPATVTSPSDGIWQPTLPSCTSSSGAASVHPIPPGLIGGYAVQLRAEWATTQPALYSRLDGSATPKVLSPPNNSRAYCALHLKTGKRRVACLDGSAVHDYDVVVSGASASLVQRDMQVIGADALAVVSVASGVDRDLYLVSTKGVVVSPFMDGPNANNLGAPCTDGTCAVDDVVVVPACGALPGRLLVHTTGAGATLRLLDARGGNSIGLPIGSISNVIRIDNAGCVTRLDPGGGPPSYRQVMTFHVGTINALTNEFTALATRAIYNCTQTSCQGNELLPGAGVAFITGNEPRMVITSLDASGVVLEQVVMAPDTAMKDLFVERSRIPAAGPPDRLAVGQFDTDSMTDLFWNISARRGTGTSFEVAYARQIGSVPLEAISAVQTLDIDAITTGDVSGEGRDDILITGRFLGIEGVAVIPMDLAASPITVPADATCQ